MLISELNNFGIVLILPECAFTAELPRDTIAEMLQDIDDRLTEQGAPDESETRSGIMVDNALAISTLIAHRQIDNEAGIADIAYSFLYAYGKYIGFNQIDILRGLTGSFLRNRLRINPCLGEQDFQRESTFLSNKMKERDENGDDEWDYDIDLEKIPTLH